MLACLVETLIWNTYTSRVQIRHGLLKVARGINLSKFIDREFSSLVQINQLWNNLEEERLVMAQVIFKKKTHNSGIRATLNHTNNTLTTHHEFQRIDVER